MKNIKPHIKKFRALALLAAGVAVSLNARAQCTINMESVQQTIDGFGACSAWCGTMSSAKDASLFGTLGFSLWRVQIVNDLNGATDGNWLAESNNAAAAHSYGAKVFGTDWYAASSSWDTNGTDWIIDSPSVFQADAQWLAKAAAYHHLDWCSPANEPDYGWQQWTTNEFVQFLTQYGSTIGVPLIAPESFQFTEPYSQTIADSVGTSLVPIVGGHSYGDTPSVHQAELNAGKHCWMTEHYLTGGQDNMSECIPLAQEVSQYMNDQFSAYVWWWMYDTDTNVNMADESGHIHKNGYTLGQFAKWVRPGSFRVSATYNPQSNVNVTAYNVFGEVVIVAVNGGSSSASQQFIIQNGNATTMTGYQTSSSESMTDIGTFTISSGSFTASLPAQSVTTFVQTAGGIANGSYKLINLNSGLALDAAGQGTGNGTQIDQWTWNGGGNQQWTVTSLGNSLYKIIGVQSGSSIDINGLSTTNGTKVQLWTYNGGQNQQFYFNAQGNGYYEISPANATGSCLDVSGVSKSPGADVWLWQWLDGVNQQWQPQAP